MTAMRWVLLGLLTLIWGCAETSSLARPSLVEGQTTARPSPQASPVLTSPGSLVPVAQLSNPASRGLFEERRAARVGDTLTVILNETTRASKDGGTKASRQANNSADANLRVATSKSGAAGNANDIRVGVGSSGNTSFDSKGGASASNQFSGTITVTVLEVLSNGNLNVAGSKRLAVGAEEEVIRFAGIVYPQTVQGNTVLSSQVADARIEYRGAGVTDEVQRAGWFTRLFMRYSPN